jgi:hypothetical protein
VISHQQNLSGKTYASIDAVSKPTKKVAASGNYDPAAARQRFAEWKAKQAGGQTAVASRPSSGPAKAGPPSPAPASEGQSKSAAAQAAPDFDPEVGF